MQTVILTTCDNASQAHLLQGALANEGIEAILNNEITSSTLPNLTGMMGMGVTVVVLKEDYDRARQVLESTFPRSAGEPCCPYCGSSDLGTSLGQRRGLKTLFSLLSLLVWTPLGNIKTIYRCHRCGEDFATPAPFPGPDPLPARMADLADTNTIRKSEDSTSPDKTSLAD